VIRYACPHCQRVCESADVMRGFTVICLGCRQPVRVPDESTAPDSLAPALPPPPPPQAPKPLDEDLDFVPPKPVVIPPPVEVPRPEIAPHPAAPEPVVEKPKPAPPPPKPEMPRMPMDSDQRRRLILFGVAAVVGLLIIAGGGLGYRWYSKRKARQNETAQDAESDERKLDIKANFTASALKRMGEKVKRWEIAPATQPKLKGKVIALSVRDAPDHARSFWNELGGRWPIEADDDVALIKELFDHGQVDDLTFALPNSLWADGPGEVGTIVGVRWQKELGGFWRDDKLIEADGRVFPAEFAEGPIAIRMRATVIILDRAAGQLVARATFPGTLPKGKPAAGKPEAPIPRPLGDVRKWLEQLDAGKVP
jgi:hypothetical protein